jgi:hypothetical protein
LTVTVGNGPSTRRVGIVASGGAASGELWVLALMAYGLAAAGFVNHLLFRRGVTREALYSNRAYMQLPGAVAFAIGGVPILVLLVTGSLPPAVATLSAAGFLAACIWAISQVVRPSPRRKPPWLVEKEARHGWSSERGWNSEVPPPAVSGELVRGVDVYRWLGLYVLDPWYHDHPGDDPDVTRPAGTVECIWMRDAIGGLGAAVLQALNAPASDPGHSGARRYDAVLAATRLKSWHDVLEQSCGVCVIRDQANRVYVGSPTPRASDRRALRAGPWSRLYLPLLNPRRVEERIMGRLIHTRYGRLGRS